MKTKSQASAETRRKLLDAAMFVIRAQGYAATTVEDICQAAGVTKGSFFHHFKSKEDLAVAAAEHFSEMANTLFAGAGYHQAADPRERLLGYIDFRRDLLQGELPNITCLLGTMVQETYDTHPAIRDACDRYISAHAAMVAEIVAQAREQYSPDADWSAESLGYFTQAVIQGALILAKAKHDPEIAGQCLDHLRRYVEMLLNRQKGVV